MLEKSFGLLFYLKQSKNQKKGPLYIYLKITVDGKSVELSSKRKCDPTKWNSAGARAMGTKEDEKRSNPKLFVNSIYLDQEFYGLDSLQVPDPTPEYLSTIYWNHLMKINNDQEVTLTFYTADITGEFKIIVQGVENKDVVYGEKKFIVKINE